jgi:hypothetical protein
MGESIKTYQVIFATRINNSIYPITILLLSVRVVCFCAARVPGKLHWPAAVQIVRFFKQFEFLVEKELILAL